MYSYIISVVGIILLVRKSEQASPFDLKTCFPPIINYTTINRLQNSPLVIGTRIKYHCEKGFYLYGVEKNECFKDSYWKHRHPDCVEHDVFKNRCMLDGKKYHINHINDHEVRLTCIKEKAAQTELNTITTITSTAAGIFGVLLLIVIIVSFQRRRILHRIRREELGNCENTFMDVYDEQILTHFPLPSYEEATRTKPTFNPPSFEETITTTQNMPSGCEERTVNGEDDDNVHVLSDNDPQINTSSLPSYNLNSEDDIFINYPHHGSSYDAPPPYPGSNDIRPTSSSSLEPLLTES